MLGHGETMARSADLVLVELFGITLHVSAAGQDGLGRAVKVGLVPMGRRREEGEAPVSSVVPDDEHWAVRASDDGLCHASEQKPLHAPSSLSANHDEVRPGAARLSQDGLSRITVKHEVYGDYVTAPAG